MDSSEAQQAKQLFSRSPIGYRVLPLLHLIQAISDAMIYPPTDHPPFASKTRYSTLPYADVDAMKFWRQSC
jgi:hypothetical protein